MNRFLFFFVLLFIAGTSCKKKEFDESAPLITVNSPAENSFIRFGDTLNIIGKISDETLVKSVKISIYDQNKDVEVIPSINYQNLGKEFNLNCNIPINNPLITTGIYYVCITAHDEMYVSKHFIPINIAEERRKYLGIIYLNKTNYYTALNLLDASNNNHSLTNLQGDLQSSEISSQYQQFYVGGALTGGLRALNIRNEATNFSINWEIQNQSNGISPWFKSLYFENNLIYVSTGDGKIVAYTTSGSPVKSNQLASGWVANQMLDYDGRFFAIIEKLGYEFPQMAQYYSSSGTFINQLPLTFQPLKMFAKEPGQLIIFGIENEVSKAYIFYFTEDHVNVQKVFGSSEIRDVAQINSNQFLVLTSNGVLLYNTDLNIPTTSLNSVLGGNLILFDSLNNQYFVIKPFSITTYNYPLGTVKATYNSSVQIEKAHLYYNR